jgi:hypothetical protein
MAQLFTADRLVLATLQVHCHVAWVSSFLLKPAKRKSKLCYDRLSLAQSVLVSSPLILGPIRDLYYCQTIANLLMWGALSEENTGISFTVATGSSPVKPFLNPSPKTLYFVVTDSRLPRTGGPGPRLYPQASFASYVSQGYCGSIRTRLHTGS